jgi:hypothetical protein
LGGTLQYVMGGRGGVLVGVVGDGVGRDDADEFGVAVAVGELVEGAVEEGAGLERAGAKDQKHKHILNKDKQGEGGGRLELRWGGGDIRS